MMSLEQFEKGLKEIPTTASWYLSDLGESRGKQELFTQQAPQKLKALREHALIESAVSSNRIEGVTIQQKRIGTIVFGKSHLKDRNEEEVRGYRDALRWIHEKGAKIPLTSKTILQLHRIARGEIWDAGKWKEKNVHIIEKYPDGRTRIRFKTVEASKTPAYVKRLGESWKACLHEKWIHPLFAIGAYNLDFLCIHPFRDGNGRVSRLLLLLQCYHLGLEVGRYISLERLIEENKERYYETLQESSHRWHEGKNDPWPYVNFLLFILKSAYKEFEQRAGEIRPERGAKTQCVADAVGKQTGEFAMADIVRACPMVSRAMIKHILLQMQKDGKVKCLGKGQSAKWKRIG